MAELMRTLILVAAYVAGATGIALVVLRVLPGASASFAGPSPTRRWCSRSSAPR
ncbi:MAG: hypothetical protein R2698_07285 [Microthrixaceae bacterium]